MTGQIWSTVAVEILDFIFRNPFFFWRRSFDRPLTRVFDSWWSVLIAHCPKMKMNGKKLSKFQFHFPELPRTSLMLKHKTKKKRFDNWTLEIIPFIRYLRLCLKYLLWVSEGIGGYPKLRSTVYGFEMGIRNWPNMNESLLYLYRIGYRKGIGNIRRVSEMYEGYWKY